ncbi:lipopolysaccharide biosynthesis protein, partial [Parabacteroides goldsteinii]
MAEETLKDKTAKGLFWGGLSTFLQQIIGMVFGIVIARILNPDDYGLVAMLAIFSAIANTIMDSGFTTALINKKTIRHEDYNAVFWFSAFCGIVIYMILFLTAPLIAKFYDQPILINLSRILFLSFLISSFGIAHNALLFKKIKVKQRGIIDIVAVFVSGSVGLILALSGFAYWGLALQLVTQCLVATLLRWYFSGWRPTFTFDFSPIKEMFGFSSKILFNNILGQVNANLFSVLLGKYYTKADTGYYSQGNKWMVVGSMIVTSMIQGVAQPVLVEVTDDKMRQKNV